MQRTVGEIMKEAWENWDKEYVLPISEFEMNVIRPLGAGDIYINFDCYYESVCKERLRNGCVTCEGGDLRP